MKSCRPSCCAIVATVAYALSPASVRAAVEAIEIGPRNVHDLPGGREADGIIGDFVLRNDRIEVLVSDNQPNRRANMAILWDAPTPGCVYDMTWRGADNDQLTWFGPGRQKGELSGVRILKDGSDGEAVIRAELTAAAGSGLGRTHDYILRDGWRHLIVVSTYENSGADALKIKPAGDWQGLAFGVMVEGVRTALCQDPADRVGYAFGPLKSWPDAQPADGEIEVAPGKTAHFAAALTIGHGSADAFGAFQAIEGKVQRFQGGVSDKHGKPTAAATIQVRLPGVKDTLVAYVDREGRYDIQLPENIQAATLKDLGRADVAIDLKPGAEQRFLMAPLAGVDVTVTDPAGGPLPCKVQFIGIEGTPTPYLGPVIRAHGCDNQYHSENGRFTQPLPPGRYQVVITRGIEYDHVERTIDVKLGEIASVSAQLKRVLDTRGWVSSDFHNHTTISGDNYCGTDDRIINLAAEHVEFAPGTEHNRIYDWRPHIERLGLGVYVGTVTGIELTGPGPHLNAFPLQPVLYRQDNGAPQWSPDPRISALLLRNMPGNGDKGWIQFNHPNMARFFNDVNDDKKADGGFVGIDALIDGAEVYGEQILSPEPTWEWEYKGQKRSHDNWPLFWMQMINGGRYMRTVATSDAHEVTQGGVGGWRMYLPSRSDDPANLDADELIAHAKAGKSVVTSGPFLEVRTHDGRGPGDTIRAEGSVRLKVRVQCNTWVTVDRVAVLVNGRLMPDLDFTAAKHPEMFQDGVVRFDREIEVALKADAHLIVVARGDNATLKTGYGQSWQSAMHPTAYHNPIFVDTDNNGFTPNDDMLGQPFLKYGKAEVQ